MFLTLTYDEKHLPLSGELQDRDVQLFFKKLRKKYSIYSYIVFKPNGKKQKKSLTLDSKRIRYYCAGEYGSNGRCHWHVCLFNVKFPDMIKSKKSKKGKQLYESKVLSDLWGNGFAWIGELTPDSAGYAAGYITEKLNGDDYDVYYIDTDSGVLLPREHALMSRRGGIVTGKQVSQSRYAFL